MVYITDYYQWRSFGRKWPETDNKNDYYGDGWWLLTNLSYKPNKLKIEEFRRGIDVPGEFEFKVSNDVRDKWGIPVGIDGWVALLVRRIE